MLVLDKVSFTYADAGSKQTEPALTDIKLMVEAGDFLGIAGATGSGKSTLAKILCGLLKPASGSVLANGRPLTWKRDGDASNALVGMAFQYPERQLFGASVMEDLAFGPKNLGVSDAESRRRARTALEQVGLDPEAIQDLNPFHLSGGQQRKVALAGILAMEPETLVLDEPAAGLDPRSHADLMELIRTLNARDGITVVMISHSMEDLACCQRIAILDKGRIAMQGTPAQAFSDAGALKAMGLALPETLAFAQEMKKAGMPLPSESPLLVTNALADAIAELMRP